MKKLILLAASLLLVACTSSELKQTQDELNQLKVEYEILQNKKRALEGTAVTNEDLVTLKKDINIELTVIDKRIVTKEDAWGDVDHDMQLIIGLADSEDNTPFSIVVTPEMAKQCEIGKRYRFSGYAIFVHENEDEHFRYEISAYEFTEITQ